MTICCIKTWHCASKFILFHVRSKISFDINRHQPPTLPRRTFGVVSINLIYFVVVVLIVVVVVVVVDVVVAVMSSKNKNNHISI